MREQTSLPASWAFARLPDLIGADGLLTDGDWVESKDQDPEGQVRLTQLADVGDGEWRNRSNRFMSTDKSTSLNCTLLEPGDVLVARMPDPLGRACIFPGDKRPSVTVVDVCIVRPGTDGISNRWLMNFINAPDFRIAVAGLQSGSTRKRISKANLCTVDLPVPPLPEQHRIVAAIDDHFSRLDAAVALLERVQRNLKRYRASVLKAAVEGRLVPTDADLARAEGRAYEPASVLLERILDERRRRWKAEGRRGTYKEPVAPDTTGLPELPEGWCWASLDQLSTLVKNGYSIAPTEQQGVPILRISAVRPMRVDPSDVRFLPGTPDAYEGYFVEPGDLLFTRYNGNPALVGVCGVVRNVPRRLVHPDKLIRVSVVPMMVSPGFVEACANTGASRGHIESLTRTTAGQAGISGSDIKHMPLPLAPFSEQLRVAEEVVRVFSVVDEADAATKADLIRAARLRQSILKWAFEGRLADQDPTDEPASVLLERIRAERAKERAKDGASNPARRGRPRQARTAT